MFQEETQNLLMIKKQAQIRHPSQAMINQYQKNIQKSLQSHQSGLLNVNDYGKKKLAAEQFKKLQEEEDDYENDEFTTQEMKDRKRKLLKMADDDEVVSHEHTHTNSSGEEGSPKNKKKKAAGSKKPAKAAGAAVKKSQMPKGASSNPGIKGQLNPASDDEKYSSEHYSEDYSSVNNKSNNQFDASAITKEVVKAQGFKKFDGYEKNDT